MNQRPKGQIRHFPLGLVRQLVAQHGRDAAAEETIVYELVSRFPPGQLGYINTDWMRKVIRRVQGRPRLRQLGGFD